MLDPNKNYKAELLKLVTEFSKEENWEKFENQELLWNGNFDPIQAAEDLIQEIITPPPSLKNNTTNI